jgi:hypothetical protein
MLEKYLMMKLTVTNFKNLELTFFTIFNVLEYAYFTRKYLNLLRITNILEWTKIFQCSFYSFQTVNVFCIIFCSKIWASFVSADKLCSASPTIIIPLRPLSLPFPFSLFLSLSFPFLSFFHLFFFGIKMRSFHLFKIWTLNAYAKIVRLKEILEWRNNSLYKDVAIE